MPPCFIPCDQDVSGGPGTKGDRGAPVKTPSQIGKPGAAGAATAATTFYRTFSSLIDPAYTAILLHRAEGLYVNGDLQRSSARLIWLKGLLEARIEDTTQLSATDLKNYQGQRYRADSLLNQMALSVDYYGQFLNAVPLLTVEAIIGELDDLFTYGSTIEAAYLTFKTAADNQKIDQTNLDTTRTSLIEKSKDLQSSLASNVQQRTTIENNVAALNQQLQSLWSQMSQAQHDFQDAVARASDGCGFAQIISMGAMVASLVTTGGTAYAAVGPALAALQGQQSKNGQTVPVPDTLDGFTYKVKTITTVGKDVKSFADALGKVKSSFGTPSVPGLFPPPPDDQAKILAQAKDIDAELDKYRNLPEANAYRTLIDNYVAAALAKNNMVLQLNALYAAWDSTNSQINQNTLQAAELQNKLSDSTDPRLPKAVMFTESAYNQSISGIVFALYNIYRAYSYYTLDQTPFSIDDTNIASLGHAKNQITQKYYNAISGFGSAPTHLQLNVDITPFLPPGALQSFTAGSTSLSFALPTDAPQFRAVSQVMVNQIGLVLASSDGPLANFSLNFTHHGHSVMLDADGNKFNFLHTPIHVPYGVDASGEVTISGDFTGAFLAKPSEIGGAALYNGVSPFGPWTIDINTMDPALRARITSVTMTFAGSARGRTPSKQA